MSFGIDQLCWFPIHLHRRKILSENSCGHKTCVADLCLYFHNTNGPGVHFWQALILHSIVCTWTRSPWHWAFAPGGGRTPDDLTESGEHRFKAQPHCSELLHFLSIKPGQVTLTIGGGDNFLQYSVCNKGAAVSHVCYVKNAGARHLTKVLPLIAWMSSRINQRRRHFCTPNPLMHGRVFQCLGR